jgi:hypothetical protein
MKLPESISSMKQGRQNYLFIKRHEYLTKEEKKRLFENNKLTLKNIEADLFNTINLIKIEKNKKERRLLEERYEYLASLYAKSNTYTDKIEHNTEKWD